MSRKKGGIQLCKMCRMPMSRLKGKKYCSPACKQRAYRIRHSGSVQAQLDAALMRAYRDGELEQNVLVFSSDSPKVGG